MNLKNRLNKIAKHLGIGEEDEYIFVRIEEDGGSFTLHGEEGKKYWDEHVNDDDLIIHIERCS